jgi:arylsulfatase A-like enzyme
MDKPSITILILDAIRLDTFNRMIKTRGLELDKLGNFLYFDKCIAPETWTLPSCASILTGLPASKHGAHETTTLKALDVDKIKLRKSTVVSELKSMRYKTYCVSANPYLNPVYGFDEFDVFHEESFFVDVWGSVIEVSKKLKPLFMKYREKYGSEGGLFTNMVRIPLATLAEDPGLFIEGVLSGMVLTPVNAAKKLKAKLIDDWPIEKGGKRMVETIRKMNFKKPFFLFIDLMEPHDPYTESKKTAMDWKTQYLKRPVKKSILELWKRLYLKACRKGYGYSYDIMKDLMSRFGDNQIIIFTSDHGQAFNEHGFVGHGAMLYDEIVKVPLAVMLPKDYDRVKKDSYSSLTNVRKFVLAAASGEKDAVRHLYAKEAVVESFGTHVRINPEKIEGIDLKKLNLANTPRRRIFRSKA